MWKVVTCVIVALTIAVFSEPDHWHNYQFSENLLPDNQRQNENKDHFFWHYIPTPSFTEPLEREERTLPREHELRCWTCFTLDTLNVDTDNCNKTLCTGKQISACYKWQVKYGFKKYRIYRGCMDNYTEIDYKNAMCRGTGLPLNETCEWELCKTDMCNSCLLLNTSFFLALFTVAFWGINHRWNI